MDEAKFDRFVERIEDRFQDFDARFARLEARFAQIDARFDQMDERFAQMDERFDQIDERFDRLDASITTLRVEIGEKFQSVYDRLDALDDRVERLAAASDEVRHQLVLLRTDVDKLVIRLDRVDANVYGVTTRINGLGDDMRQRFRLVNERLTTLEQRLAA